MRQIRGTIFCIVVVVFVAPRLASGSVLGKREEVVRWGGWIAGRVVEEGDKGRNL